MLGNLTTPALLLICLPVVGIVACIALGVLSMLLCSRWSPSGAARKKTA